MRLAWATPFNIHSAIAIYSREVCHELVRLGVNVEILRIEDPESDAIEALESSLIVHPARTALTNEFLSDFDAIIVNIGDYTSFHLGALRLLTMAPVISVIHDSDLRHFISGAAQRGFRIGELAARLPEQSYHDTNDKIRASEVALLATLSCACIAHGSHYVELLRASCPGPVAFLPLCYPDLGAITPNLRNDSTFVITTFGMINANKQPERVMRAIASSKELKENAIYRLVGPITDVQRTYLEELAKVLGLRQPEIYGRVSDEELFEFLSKTNVICCLRYPISEGGSASLITAVFSKRPIIVPAFASYADLPDDLFWKVSYGEDVDDLAAALSSIEADRAAAEARIKPMEAWAQRTYSASVYVERLIPLIEAAIKAAPKIEIGRTFGRMLASMEVSPTDPILTRLEAQINDVFDRAETFNER